MAISETILFTVIDNQVLKEMRMNAQDKHII